MSPSALPTPGLTTCLQMEWQVGVLPHHMQNQNGQMPGPNHIPMQGPGPNQLNMTNSSMNMPSSSHGSKGGCNHSVPSSQSMPVQNHMTMSQGQPMGNYGPRPNMSMQPNQGPVMHQQPPSQQYNMPQGGGQHYQGQQPPMGMMSQANQGTTCWVRGRSLPIDHLNRAQSKAVLRPGRLLWGTIQSWWTRSSRRHEPAILP